MWGWLIILLSNYLVHRMGYRLIYTINQVDYELTISTQNDLFINHFKVCWPFFFIVTHKIHVVSNIAISNYHLTLTQIKVKNWRKKKKLLFVVFGGGSPEEERPQRARVRRQRKVGENPHNWRSSPSALLSLPFKTPRSSIPPSLHFFPASPSSSL